MNKFAAIILFEVQRRFTYRINFLILLIWGLLYIVIRVYIWGAIFGVTNTSQIAGYTLDSMIIYFIISYITTVLIGFEEIEENISRSVISGNLDFTLLRPISLSKSTLSNSIGKKVDRLLFLILPIIIIGSLFFNLLSVGVINILLFIASLIVAVIMGFFMSYAFSAISFYTNETRGFRNLKHGITNLLGGNFLPLNLFPLWAQGLFAFFPFQYMVFIPASIYLGKLTGTEILASFLIQGVWIAVFFFLSRIAWTAGLKKYSGVGA